MGLKFQQVVTTLPQLMRDPFDVKRGVIFFDGVVDTPPVRLWFESMVRGLDAARRAELEALTREPVDVAALAALPTDTFGYAHTQRMGAMGFDPEFHLKALPSSGEALARNWIYARFAKLHDFHHVLLGVDVSPQAELALQIFLASNTRDPVAAMFLAGLPYFASRYGGYERIVRGCARLGRLGASMPNVFHFPYERHYATPLVEVRRLMGVPPEGVPV